MMLNWQKSAVWFCCVTQLHFDPIEQIAEISLVHAESWVEIDVIQLCHSTRPISK